MFFFQAEDGIRDLVRSRGLGDVYKRQEPGPAKKSWREIDRARSSSYHATETLARHEQKGHQTSVTRELSLIHI